MVITTASPWLDVSRNSQNIFVAISGPMVPALLMASVAVWLGKGDVLQTVLPPIFAGMIAWAVSPLLVILAEHTNIALSVYSEHSTSNVAIVRFFGDIASGATLWVSVNQMLFVRIVSLMAFLGIFLVSAIVFHMYAHRNLKSM